MGAPRATSVARDVEDQRRWLRFLPIISLAVSLSAFGFALYSAYLQRKVLRQSNRPHMVICYFFNQQGSGFLLMNHGVGAAYLHWFQILFDGQPQTDWGAMSCALGADPSVTFQFLQPAAVWPAGNRTQVYWVPPGNFDQHLRQSHSRIDFKLCYCSIFDECWLGSRHYAPKGIATCSPPPKIRFGGFSEPPSDW
jgi:hypothetical protein